MLIYPSVHHHFGFFSHLPSPDTSSSHLPAAVGPGEATQCGEGKPTPQDPAVAVTV